jgi:hypothetical protein
MLGQLVVLSKGDPAGLSRHIRFIFEDESHRHQVSNLGIVRAAPAARPEPGSLARRARTEAAVMLP